MGILPKGTLLLLLTTVCARAQSPALLEMVEAEKAFISMAKSENRRDAFLHYLSDSVVTQGPDGPFIGKARILAQPVTEDWLFWEVAYSDISSSGDFGFNTGPWFYRSKKSDESPVAFGEFNSVWKRKSDGTWKNVLDIGIPHGPVKDPVTWSTSRLALKKSAVRQTMTVPEVEGKFQKALDQDHAKAYRDFISPEVRMMFAGHLPVVGSDKLDSYLADSPPTKNYVLLGSEAALSGDMGYVYGTVDVTITKDDKREIKKATFVRIWKMEHGNWKIVLDVLTYNP